MVQTNEVTTVISVDKIPVIDPEVRKKYVDTYHKHGFLNELYKLLIDRVRFQLSQGSLGFHLSAFDDGATVSESGMSITFNALQIHELLRDYFTRHPDVFFHYFPEFKKKKVRNLPFDSALGGIIKSSLIAIPALGGDKTLNRLTGIVALLQQDQQSKQQLDAMLLKKAAHVVHEYTHQLVHKLAPYYKFKTEKYAGDLFLRIANDQELSQLRKTLHQRIGAQKEPLHLREVGMEYLRLVLKKLIQANPSEVSPNPKVLNYLKTLYGIGIEEIVARIIESQLEHMNDAQTIEHLKQNLFETTDYYLKPSGIVLPEMNEIVATIQSIGAQQAFQAILEKYYTDQAFDTFLERSNLLQLL